MSPALHKKFILAQIEDTAPWDLIIFDLMVF
jgi:hypothetical protein